ncbi:hypothetical protein [Akkermansia sp.]|nr:hypothetical protein [Akkermansia sp.]
MRLPDRPIPLEQAPGSDLLPPYRRPGNPSLNSPPSQREAAA